MKNRATPNPEQEQAFRRLSQQAAQCTTCPRMVDQKAVLGPANGPLTAELMIVAEAPGRLGSGRTGIPFSGDKSGENFETLIAHAGLTRNDMFITNAVLCNPLSEGCNSRPTMREMDNCAPYLQSVLELLQPRLIVTLGGVGLQALNRLWGTRFKLADCAAKTQKTEGPLLLPLYHPSPRVTHWKRTLKQQKKDFQKVRRVLENLRRP